ncbi:MAG TPA: hypothetical protein VGQ87_02220 [Patescibacteria group bacterium]|jgi:hypothetical protein|nr:hypothetical protein [Patescibacteria group bacterium]
MPPLIETKFKALALLAIMALLGFLLQSFLAQTVLAIAVSPQLPRIYLDTTYVSSSGKSIYVHTGDDLQIALDQAEPGDEIVLDAGTSFVGSFKLPNKTGSSMITIRTSNIAGITPAGLRIDPSRSFAMPKIISPGKGLPALTTEAGAHNYRLIGIEFTKANPQAVSYELISLGTNDSTQISLASVPHDIILDRIYVHGDPASDLKRCVALNSAFSAVIDSYIADCHVVGQDAQAIGGFNGPGPFKIANNYLSGSGENVIFGGADPQIPNLVPADIEIRGNLVSKPLSWKGGTPHWSVKNLFELKNAQRVLIEGNVFENNWVDGQSGWAIVLTPRNQDGGCPWCIVSDVTFQNNIVRHSAAGINLLAQDNNHPSQVTSRIEIYNNVFDDINGAAWGGGNGAFLMMTSGGTSTGPNDVQIAHNTVLQTGTMIAAGDYISGQFIPKSNFVFTDNIALHNLYGVKGDNDGMDDITLGHYFPDAVFAGNNIVGGNPTNFKLYPGNFFPATLMDVGFANPAWDYHLTGSYKNKASDGTDVGANIDQINQAIAGNFTPSPVSVIPPINNPGSSSTPPMPISTHANGTLFKYASDATVYYLDNGVKRGFASESAFIARHFSFSQIITIPVSEQYASGSIMDLPDGVLIKGSSATVYLKEQGMLRAFTSASSFLNRGFSFFNVMTVADNDLARENSGPII